MKILYLILAVVGAMVPYAFFFGFFAESGVYFFGFVLALFAKSHLRRQSISAASFAVTGFENR